MGCVHPENQAKNPQLSKADKKNIKAVGGLITGILGNFVPGVG